MNITFFAPTETLPDYPRSRARACRPNYDTLYFLKLHGILKISRNRGGWRRINSESTKAYRITVVITQRHPNTPAKRVQRDCCLIWNTRQSTSSTSQQSPKCDFVFQNFHLLTFVAQLKQRTPLERLYTQDHLKKNDIEVCVASEIHLEPDKPESIVSMPI